MNRITEWFVLERTFKGNLFQLLPVGQGHLPLCEAAQNHVQHDLPACSNRTSMASLGSLFQCLSTLITKNVLMPNLKLSSFNLRPLPLVLSLQALVKVSLHLSYEYSLYIKARCINSLLVFFFMMASEHRQDRWKL